MRYFYDCEFIEDGKTIDLISIGMVAEDGREYYAISTAFNPKRANDWVKENVLIHLPPRNPNPAEVSPDICREARAWKNRADIALELMSFCSPEKHGKPELWGYYSAYDHVALCQLFGAMMNLPKGWPMYTRDIKQWCDAFGNPQLPEQGKSEHHALADARWNRQAWEYLLTVGK